MHLSQSLLTTFLMINSVFAVNETLDLRRPSIEHEHASITAIQPDARSQQPLTESTCWLCSQREDVPGLYKDLCPDHKQKHIRQQIGRLTIAANCFLLCMLACYFIGLRH